jgi:hypothetical protein
MMPPTIPPAIAPVFELLLCGAWVGVNDRLDADTLDLFADVVTMETVPVTSGESGRHQMKLCGQSRRVPNLLWLWLP